MTAVMPQLDMLRGITRQMATSDDFETVLQSIVSGLVDRGQAVLARIFLLVEDQDCVICRARIDAGQMKPTTERMLHLVAEGGGPPGSANIFHRLPLDSRLPVAEIARTRQAFLVDDWRSLEQFRTDERIAPLWNSLGVIGVAGYPLEVHGELLGAIGYLARRKITVEEYEVLGIFADQSCAPRVMSAGLSST